MKISRSIWRLSIIALLIAAGFYVGAVLNISSLPKNTEIVTVRNFSANIQKAINGELDLKADDEITKVPPEELSRWIESYRRNYSGENDFRLAVPAVEDYLKSLAPHINTEPVNAKLSFENNRATEFVPSVSGKKLNIQASILNIAQAMLGGSNSAFLVIDNIEPEITLEKIDNLGIVTLLGQGESNFSGSTLPRVNNIKVGSARFNGIILKPGEEFSFNNLLGEVEDKNGYQAELVIKNGKLIKEYGGGLCQVSTTIFRAAIFAGLPVKERKPHSFPVRYYNPQGFDATIYPGVVDLKFVNDTPNHILIQTKIIKNKLAVEIYGSKDGREAEVKGPFQYAQKKNGAMKAYFIRKISYSDGQLKEERFDSVYKPPPASPLERNPLE